MASFAGSLRSRIEEHGALWAALLAACASLPGLWFPFLSDDWLLVHSVSAGAPPLAAYEYFRPLYMLSYWLDLRLWGASPVLFHLTNLLAITATTALVVTLVRRYTADAGIAAWSGLLFALHPSHVENAAWIAVRGDPLYCIFFLLAALAYDRWREKGRGLPVTAAALFAVALLVKESAAALPLFLAAVGLLDRGRRPSRREWLFGLLPLALLAAVHLLIVRPLALGGAGRSLTPGFGLGWIKQALGYTVAAVIPADVDQLVFHPVRWGGIGAAALVILLAAARHGSRKLPPLALAGAVAFAVLLGPSIIGFQDRYLFLPTAASCVALVALVRSARWPVTGVLALLLAGGWLFGWVLQWNNWEQAATASRSLVSGLVEAASRPGVEEIVVANMPFRVRHGSVAGDFRAALAVSGSRLLPVRAGSYISIPEAGAETLDGPPALAITPPPPEGVVRLRLEQGPFSRCVWPRPAIGSEVDTPVGSVRFEGAGRVIVKVRPDPEHGRAAYAWTSGRLVPIFLPPPTPE